MIDINELNSKGHKTIIIDGVMVAGNLWKRPEFETDGFPKFNTNQETKLDSVLRYIQD